MAESVRPGAPGEIQLSATALFFGRAAEQVALAATSLVLAARLGPDEFAPIGVLLVVNSLALTMADVGLGLRLLRLEEGATVDRRSVARIRRLNGAGCVASVALGGVIGGEAGVILLASGALWVLCGEGTVRKAAALRRGATARVAVSEVIGAVFLMVAVALAWASPSAAVAWAAVGLAGKQAIEMLLATPWRWALGEGDGDADWLGLWLSQALAFLIGNLDYVIVGAVLGARALAVYVLAYRLANAVPSQVAFVAGRAVTVDLASGSADARQKKYERYTRVLFVAGAVGGALVVLAAPVLAGVLGGDWAGTGWVLSVLALAAPWRTVLGTGGTLAIIANGANQLLRWEGLRLVGVAALLAASAAVGFPAFLACVVLVPVASTLVYHRLAGALAGVDAWSPLVPAAIATLLLLLAAMIIGSASLSAVS